MQINFSEISTKIKILVSKIFKIIKKYYDILLIVFFILFIIFGFMIFYKLVYLPLLGQVPEVNLQNLFVNEKLYQEVQDWLDFKQSGYEERVKEKIPDPFK